MVYDMRDEIFKSERIAKDWKDVAKVDALVDDKETYLIRGKMDVPFLGNLETIVVLTVCMQCLPLCRVKVVRVRDFYR